jgi:hypothetical protein
VAFGTKSDDEIQYLTDLSCLAHEVREQTKVLLFVPLPDHPVGISGSETDESMRRSK